LAVVSSLNTAPASADEDLVPRDSDFLCEFTGPVESTVTEHIVVGFQAFGNKDGEESCKLFFLDANAYVTNRFFSFVDTCEAERDLCDDYGLRISSSDVNEANNDDLGCLEIEVFGAPSSRDNGYIPQNGCSSRSIDTTSEVNTPG